MASEKGFVFCTVWIVKKKKLCAISKPAKESTVNFILKAEYYYYTIRGENALKSQSSCKDGRVNKLFFLWKLFSKMSKINGISLLMSFMFNFLYIFVKLGFVVFTFVHVYIILCQFCVLYMVKMWVNIPFKLFFSQLVKQNPNVTAKIPNIHYIFSTVGWLDVLLYPEQSQGFSPLSSVPMNLPKIMNLFPFYPESVPGFGEYDPKTEKQCFTLYNCRPGDRQL